MIEQAQATIEEWKAERKAYTERKDVSKFVYHGEHEFTRVEDKFYHIVNDYVESEKTDVSKMTREELEEHAEMAEFIGAEHATRYNYLFAIMWNTYTDEQKQAFKKYFDV